MLGQKTVMIRTLNQEMGSIRARVQRKTVAGKLLLALETNMSRMKLLLVKMLIKENGLRSKISC